MTLIRWAALTLTVLLSCVLLYWLLIITEGTYLGQRVVIWLYDLVAKRYDTIKGFDSEIEAACLGRPLAQALKEYGTPFVLDVGTGTGRLPLTLFSQPGFKGRVIGLDNSAKMLQVAATKLLPCAHRAMLIQRTASNLPFVDDSFDAVTCLEMLEFSPSPLSVLREAVRVLKPGGILLTTRRTGLDAHLMPGKTYSIEAFEQALLDLGLQAVSIKRWQVDYDLVWARSEGAIKPAVRHPQEILKCPKCNADGLEMLNTEVSCARCKAVYPIIADVIRMSS